MFNARVAPLSRTRKSQSLNGVCNAVPTGPLSPHHGLLQSVASYPYPIFATTRHEGLRCDRIRHDALRCDATRCDTTRGHTMRTPAMGFSINLQTIGVAPGEIVFFVWQRSLPGSGTSLRHELHCDAVFLWSHGIRYSRIRTPGSQCCGDPAQVAGHHSETSYTMMLRFLDHFSRAIGFSIRAMSHTRTNIGSSLQRFPGK